MKITKSRNKREGKYAFKFRATRWVRFLSNDFLVKELMYKRHTRYGADNV